jgi:hypothetical protein
LFVPIDPANGLERKHVDSLTDWANPSNHDGTTT